MSQSPESTAEIPQPSDDSPVEAASPTAVRDAPKGSLWRDGNFLTMWSGQALAQVGSQVTELAIPVLAVLLLQASEFEVGLLNAAGVAAFLVVGLPAGSWIDRMRKRRVMIWADAVRAVALGVLPVLWWLGMLEMWHLYAVALVVGVATVFFDVSYQSIIPSLVRTDQIAEANGKLEATRELANIGGPAVGGWLIGIISAPFAILATVGTYVASFVALLLTRDHEEPRAADDRGPIMREIGEGLRWVFAHHHQFALRTHISPMAALICLSSWIAGEAGAGAIVDQDASEQAALAAKHFGWADQVSELVALGTDLVAEVGRGDA